MNLLQDIITYIRRIIKSPSNSQITDDLIIDYINRFWIMDVSAEMQLFDLKTKYQFITSPGVDRYNMPLYNVQTQPGNQEIGMYPVYQGFTGLAYINGIQVGLQTQKEIFFSGYPNVPLLTQIAGVGDGVSTNYNLLVTAIAAPAPQNPPFNMIVRGHVDMAGIMATGVNLDPPTGLDLNHDIPLTSIDPAVFISAIGGDGKNIVITDSGQFLSSNNNIGLLMTSGKAPFDYLSLPGYSPTLNTINYATGEINVTFQSAIPAGNNITVQCCYFQSGMPRMILYHNNTITLRSPPSAQFLVELDAYLTPSAFLNTDKAIPFGYMAEYIARGAARKILSDTGDVEQFHFYEPLFLEQKMLVWKRSQRQFTATRTTTIYMQDSQVGQNSTSGIGYGGF